MRAKYVFRIRILSLFFCAFALALAGRLYFVQIVDGSAYEARADRQHVHQSEGIFDRGSIFFKDKRDNLISAATLQSGFFLTINPTLIDDAEALYATLSPLLPLEQEAFIARASKKEDTYEEITHRIPKEIAEKIDALLIPGLHLYKEQWRFYPGNSLAAQVIGFLSYQAGGTTIAGSYGLEKQYDAVLERHRENLYANFFAQVFSDLKAAQRGAAAEGDLITTIEPTVQVHLEEVLRGIKEKWNSKLIGGIVIDPRTGAIYAMGNYPTFDLNRFSEVGSATVFDNPLVQNVYEMGSIIKPLTMAAGIDAGVVTATTTYSDRGTITLNKKTISNFDGKARGVVPMQEVLSQSLNVGAAEVMLRLGRERFSQYFRAYGFGAKTGIDLPGEVRGLVDTSLGSPRDIEHANAAFGQGIGLTSVQTVRALSALGNGGTLPTPHVVAGIHSKLGFTDEVAYPKGERVLSERTSEEITRMLVKVVDEALAGGAVKLEHYSIAAKTGTAQIAKQGGGGYYEDRYLHSFFGYFPAYDPRFLVFLFQVEPQGAQYASATLTEPFMDMTKFLINYYDISPDR